MSNVQQPLNFERFTPSVTTGLSDSQVNLRLQQNLSNKVNQKYSKSYINIITNNVCTFFNLLGLICFISLIATGATLNQFIFVFFYVANISIGIIQEIRAKKCVDKLSLVANKGVKVIRNGTEMEVATTDVVLDDIMRLGIGNQIPTDSKILEGEIEVNESLLTGESVPVKKRVGDTLLAGSFITSGVCFAIAEKVGKDNYVETLSEKAKAYKKPNSEIMNSLKLVIKFVGCIILPIAAALIIKSLILNPGKVASSVLGSATVVIGMIPAGMILLTSVALAVGIVKLARHNTLVQDLYSLEMLARVDTLCFDKTGTITDGKMTVSDVVKINDTNVDIKEIIGAMLGALKDNNQTAIALYNYFGQNNSYKAIKTLPFNSSRKLSAVTFDKIGTYAFGAPEFLLNDAKYAKIEEQINGFAAKGLRVLALAHSLDSVTDDSAPSDFSPIALILIVDNVREDAISTISWFKENGVNIKVISGDNPITVAEVSKRVGIDGADKYVSLDGLSDQEVYEVANKYTVFGRVTPEQKAILVKAMKDAGHVTAMTGDGVNDILALKEADCAISVAAGSDAARNVSHLVLTDNNFNSLPKVVYEGRRVINNVQSSASLFLMKTLFTMLMAVISLCLPYMHTYPFVASQMNPLEFVVIGIPAFFLSLQPNDSRVEGRFISHVIKNSLPAALLMITSVVIVEIIKKTVGYFDDSVYTNMQVYLILIAGLINLCFVCRPFNKYKTILFSLASACVLGIVISSIFNAVPFINNFFMYKAMMPISEYWHHILIVLGISIIDIPLAILLQKLFRKVNFDNFGRKQIENMDK
ncbi:MAG: HAD family hydrolase [Clostridiales bacterium]|nr:HAD family hydrolase [Clostridiales bacterium]